ncbi:MAG TPA: hypothetical protein VGH11_18115 [Jatrophihabitans sp.]|jgi:hypothetical protein
MTDVAPPQRLLGPASVFLQSHNYLTRSLAIGGDTTILLAEDPYFALAVAEFSNAQDIAAVEEAGAAALAEQISPNAGVKRWDAYLILLSSAPADKHDMPESVTNIVYNTSFFRRIVKWNVSPTSASLDRALRAFVPLTSAPNVALAVPVDRLVERLPSFGISSQDAEAAIARFKATKAQK